MILYSYERKGIYLLIVFISSLCIFPRLFIKQKHDLYIIPVLNLPEIPEVNVPEIPEVLDLNRVDSASLVKIKGIGGYYASKIIAYRKKLGGYYSVSQLKELNMTYFNVDSLAHLFTVDPSYIQKKELNQMSFKEVLSHPYLEYEDVKMIFNAKNRYKSVSFDTLKNRGVLPDYKLRKIKPYYK
ncbi:helix-hairpin-helix domain-containing protein [Odoribacter sp. OttesenSCG-928-G04]|nr:helix-hairpin-helix domain-containing protein [Odoribacter sp. OttesenSCG-928-G04]